MYCLVGASQVRRYPADGSAVAFAVELVLLVFVDLDDDGDADADAVLGDLATLCLFLACFGGIEYSILLLYVYAVDFIEVSEYY